MSVTWKENERAIARRLGGKRVGATGQRTPDVITEWLAVELKTRRKLPRWLISAVEQVKSACPDSKLRIVLLHEVGKRHTNDLVVMSLKDFEDWFGRVGHEDEDEPE